MITAKYKNRIKKIIQSLATNNTEAFIFGSSLINDKFNDVDIGIIDKNFDEKIITIIKNALEGSSIPYNIDVVHLNKTDKAFRNKILKEKISWLIQKTQILP